MAYAPRKKPLDFDGNLDKVTLGLELGYRVRVTVRWGVQVIPVSLGTFHPTLV